MKKFIYSILFIMSIVPSLVFGAGLTLPQGGLGTTTVPKNYVIVGNNTQRITAVATSTLKLLSSDIIEGLSNLFYTDTRVATYINASTTIANASGVATGNLLGWNGTRWASVATSSIKYNHTDLGNLLFTASGHTGTAFRLFGTNVSGAAAEYATSALKILTSDLIESGSLFYTDARVNLAVSASTTVPHVGGLAYGNALIWNGGAWTAVATSTLKVNADDVTLGASNLFYTDTRVATYINASTTIAQPGGAVQGYVPMWNGSRWIASATSTCVAITGSADLCDGSDAGGSGGGDVARWTVGTGVIYNATTTDNVGVGTTTPWGRLSVANSAVDYTKPLFTVATSSDNAGQLFSVFATNTTYELTSSSSVPISGVRVVIGNLIKSFQNFFVDGSIGSSWENLTCDGFVGVALSADINNYICGWVGFDEQTTATFSPVTTGPAETIGMENTLAVGSAVAADFAMLYGYPTFNTQTGSTTPAMEAVIGAPLVNSSTTAALIGFTAKGPGGSAVMPIEGCYFSASSTEPYWQTVSRANGGSYRQNSTGVSTTTSRIGLRVEMNQTSCTFYYKEGFGGHWIKSQTHTDTADLPNGPSTVIVYPEIMRFRAANGTAIAPSLRVYSFSSWRRIPWRVNQY